MGFGSRHGKFVYGGRQDQPGAPGREFCHVRLFDEMLRTCGLDKVEWVPLGPIKEKIYEQFPKFPGFLMDSPAFVTELMGVTYYCHLHRLFDEILASEPEVRERLKELLDEITIDEVAHVGQRRNFIGPLGMKISKALVKPFYTLFFNDIPEIKQLFDVDQMIEDGVAFDFNKLPDYMIERTWIPSYCKTENAFFIGQKSPTDIGSLISHPDPTYFSQSNRGIQKMDLQTFLWGSSMLSRMVFKKGMR